VHGAGGDRADQVDGRDVARAEAVVVGASEIAGKPIALLLTGEMATVTLCHVATATCRRTRGGGRSWWWRWGRRG